jgi:two-component system cell cycle sensor histidine kinase/response regulator CckA
MYDHRVTELERELVRLRTKSDALGRELEEARPYRVAVEGSPLSILHVSGAKGRYVFVNEAFAKMLGQDRDELLARDPYEVWRESAHPEDLEAEHNAMGRLAKGEIDRFQLDKRVVAKNGEARWYRMDAFASRNAQGRLECLTAYFSDIQKEYALGEARDKLEDELRHVQKVGALGRLAGGIAHDFNNRLVVIMCHAELLTQRLPPDSPLLRHADMVLSSAKRAAELTRHLLAYSRRQVLAPEAFDLNAMADRMLTLLKSVLSEGIEVVTDLRAKRHVLADPGQIEQVILNLALNARDAMPEGGRLTIETHDETVASGEHPTLAPGDYVTLVVADSGTGIPETALPHIFEPFFTTKETGRGTGLGLSMVEGIVHQSGGAIRVESKIDRGTTFTIHLPHSTPVAAPAFVEDEPPLSSNFETILLCEDDNDVRDLVAAVLGLRAYSVLKAKNGQHALEIARKHPGRIHLLLSDLAMPGMTGIELASELRKRDPALRVLFVSGYTDDTERVSMLRSPGTHFLPKPFLPGDLTRAVSQILDRSESSAP